MKRGNLGTGAVLRADRTGHTQLVQCVAYSPNGRHIVSGSFDNTIRIWDAETGAAVGVPLTGHTSGVNSVACSPDGRHIVSGSFDRSEGRRVGKAGRSRWSP